MLIGAIWRRWIEILASLYLAWRDSQRESRSIVVTRESQLVVARRAETGRDSMLRDGQEGTVLASATLGAGVSSELSRAAHNSFVIYELPNEKVVMRQITVPEQARRFLSGVIHNQIERLSPWPADSVVYGFAAEPRENTPVVDVRVLIAARADIDSARRDLATLGLSVDRIEARGSNTEAAGEAAGSVTLWARSADTSPDKLHSTARAFGIGIVASVAVSLLVALLVSVSNASIRNESEDIAARSKVLQRQVQAGRTAASLASIPPAERAWLLKNISASSVVLIEALSRALPDSAYVSEIHLEKDSLRIVGLAEDVPALLAPLERSEHMTDVHFVAPTARGPDGKLFRFSIEAHVEPRIKIAEH